MAESGRMADADACRAIVQAGDKDWFLAALFAPETVRPHLHALQAFAVELARIPHIVTEPQIGEIRLQWWADTLDAMPDGDGGHPVARGLQDVIKAHGLPVAPLHQMVEARRHDLYADPLPDQTALEAYFGETVSVLIQLQVMVLDKAAAHGAATAAGYAGVAFGIARRLATAGPQAMPLPGDRRDVLGLATKRLAQARDAITELPKTVLPAFLPVATTELYLKAAAKGGAEVAQWRRQWRIWRAASSERI